MIIFGYILIFTPLLIIVGNSIDIPVVGESILMLLWFYGGCTAMILHAYKFRGKEVIHLKKKYKHAEKLEQKTWKCKYIIINIMRIPTTIIIIVGIYKWLLLYHRYLVLMHLHFLVVAIIIGYLTYVSLSRDVRAFERVKIKLSKDEFINKELISYIGILIVVSSTVFLCELFQNLIS